MEMSQARLICGPEACGLRGARTERLAQGAGNLGGALGALLELLLEAVEDHAGEALRHVRRERARIRRRRVHVVIRNVPLAERQLARRELEQRHAEAVEVGA